MIALGEEMYGNQNLRRRSVEMGYGKNGNGKNGKGNNGNMQNMEEMANFFIL